jgi:hypothetical protein
MEQEGLAMILEKIISGGQTGADIGGLKAAMENDIKTGGVAPYKYKTENGPNPDLSKYGLIDCAVSSYTYRTELNVKESDGTVIFMRTESPGSKQTANYCQKLNKRFLSNPKDPKDLAIWVLTNNIGTLNVAGNRESKSPGIETYVKDFISETIKLLQEA